MTRTLAFYLKVLFWAFFFMIAMRILLRTPLSKGAFVVEAVFIAILLLFYIYRIFTALAGKSSFTKYEVYLSTFLIFPFWSAFAAYYSWNQPFIFGVAAQRGFYLFLSAFFLLYALNKKIVTPQILLKSFLLLGWCSLIGFYVATKVINPIQYIDTEMVEFSSLKGGYIFHFYITFITIGFLYYTIQFFKTGNYLYWIPSILFLAYIVFVRQDRSIILTVFAGIGLYFLQNEMKKYFLKTVFTGLIVITGILAVFVSSGPQLLTGFFVKYENIIKVVSGQSTTESSTNVRKKEALKVFPHIIKNPLLGNGDLSQQWRNGFERIMGHLYPADLGIIGEIFLFGLLGTLIINSQFILALKYSAASKYYSFDTFYLTCKYALFTFFMDSFTAGQTIFFAANSILLITILYYYKNESIKIAQKKILESNAPITST